LRIPPYYLWRYATDNERQAEKRFLQKEVLNMQLLDSSVQQYIINPTLLIQLIRVNFISAMIDGAFLLALVVFILHLSLMVGFKHGKILNIDIFHALKNALNSTTWTHWITPLTGAGGLLGLVVLVRTNETFTELSLLFAALLLLAPLVSATIKGPIGTSLSTILNLWAVIGELSATCALLLTFNLSSLLITNLLRVIAGLTIVLLGIYCKRQTKQQSVKQANSSLEEQTIPPNDIQAGSHNNNHPVQLA
jgi:hypothetical protein